MFASLGKFDYPYVIIIIIMIMIHGCCQELLLCVLTKPAVGVQGFIYKQQEMIFKPQRSRRTLIIPSHGHTRPHATPQSSLWVAGTRFRVLEGALRVAGQAGGAIFTPVPASLLSCDYCKLLNYP